MSIESKVFFELDEKEQRIVSNLYHQTCVLLDHTYRFKYFTLHGSIHTNNLLRILDILCEAGLELSKDEAFLLLCVICVHDVGMVIPLHDKEIQSIFPGGPQPADPAHMELKIRDRHNSLVANYINKHFDFLIGTGLTPPQCSLISNIAKGHRVVDLDKAVGHEKNLGALIRVIDELDIGPDRAPCDVLKEHYEEMDTISAWHWFKHNITDPWMMEHNVITDSIKGKKVSFRIGVHPSTERSIDYWLKQVSRPIYKVLVDERCSIIILNQWGLHITFDASSELSSTGFTAAPWPAIEDKVISGKRKTILLIDDEVNKMEDLFIPLMCDFQIFFSATIKDAFMKLKATRIDLTIVDMQMGSSHTWTPEETSNYKLTGLLLAKKILGEYPDTKVGVLTGSRHDLSEVEDIRDDLAFLLKKPIDPDHFEQELRNVLT